MPSFENLKTFYLFLRLRATFFKKVDVKCHPPLENKNNNKEFSSGAGSKTAKCRSQGRDLESAQKCHHWIQRKKEVSRGTRDVYVVPSIAAAIQVTNCELVYLL